MAQNEFFYMAEYNRYHKMWRLFINGSPEKTVAFMEWDELESFVINGKVQIITEKRG